jgi:hypothetical protein
VVLVARPGVKGLDGHVGQQAREGQRLAMRAAQRDAAVPCRASNQTRVRAKRQTTSRRGSAGVHSAH